MDDDEQANEDAMIGSASDRICHVFPRPLVGGILVRRYKRFLADVILEDGLQVTVHCPNSGSMKGCLEPGAPVRCSPRHSENRKTAYTWEMIEIDGTWIGINTIVPNKLVACAAERRAFPVFASALAVRREVRLGNSRIDACVDTPEGPFYVEVKNVTLAQDGEALFPDAVTSRGARHLEELMKVVRQGGRAAMIYVAQRSDVRSFRPAHEIDPHYARLYDVARTTGVEIHAFRADVTPDRICLAEELEVGS